MTNDPHAWLEDVTGTEQLAWVTARNARTEDRLTGTDEFTRLESGIREVLDSDARIPWAGKRGEYYYNFWTDERNPRGQWRRTTPEQYRTPDPTWDVLLDVDALNAAEGENWVWHGARILRPDHDRALVDLSRGGADADVTREFDLVTRQWVDDGFVRPESKGGVSWIDRDTVFVATDTGEGSMTTSGYPRVARRWTRGTPLAEAQVVYAGEPDDLSVSAYHDPTPGWERDFVRRALAFYSDELHLLDPDGTLRKVPVPDSAITDVEREWLLVELREDWDGFAAGSLLATRFDDALAGSASWDVLFAPTPSSSLAGWTWTRAHLVLNVLEDVVNRLEVLTPGDDGWARAAFPGAPEFGSVGVGAVDSDDSDEVWLTVTDYLTPSTLAIATVGAQGTGTAPEVLKSSPAFFDASRHVIEQHFATSDDGTRVPYFLVRPADLPFDGNAPTLLYGYGGFEIALTPGYSGAMGRSWLERGGVYVVANLRGGGEYGPRWHRAALRENRPRAYEDMAAVAADLIERRITTPAHLGVQGGSNGGLMAGNMLVRDPGLFGAVVIQVPLLDMKRYSHLLAGASWIAEYGDPDTDDWDFIRTFSPYHLIDADAAYPPVALLTSTRDDRVHPGHARKFAAALTEAGHDVTYYENIEGGHGGAADNRQAARMSALAYAFLWEKLA